MVNFPIPKRLIYRLTVFNWPNYVYVIMRNHGEPRCKRITEFLLSEVTTLVGRQSLYDFVKSWDKGFSIVHHSSSYTKTIKMSSSFPLSQWCRIPSVNIPWYFDYIKYTVTYPCTALASIRPPKFVSKTTFSHVRYLKHYSLLVKISLLLCPSFWNLITQNSYGI